MVDRILSVLLIAALLQGCANPGAAERERASHAFGTNLVAETERVLREADGALTLSNAVALAGVMLRQAVGLDLLK